MSSNAIKYSILNLERHASYGGVFLVLCKIVAQKENNVFSTNLEINFEPNPNDENFIAYENLTEEIVLSWVKNKLNTEAIETQLVKNLELQSQLKTFNGIPWTTNEVNYER
jgi:hypothetical protein